MRLPILVLCVVGSLVAFSPFSRSESDPPYIGYAKLIDSLVDNPDATELYGDLARELSALTAALISRAPHEDVANRIAAHDETFRRFTYAIFSGRADYLMMMVDRGGIDQEEARSRGADSLRDLLGLFPMSDSHEEDWSLLSQLAHFMSLIDDRDLFASILDERMNMLPQERKSVVASVLAEITNDTTEDHLVREHFQRGFRTVFQLLQTNRQSGGLTRNPLFGPDPFANEDEISGEPD